VTNHDVAFGESDLVHNVVLVHDTEKLLNVEPVSAQRSRDALADERVRALHAAIRDAQIEF
jgi:hypothetical protein